MKPIFMLFVCMVIAYGYGYEDASTVGGRVQALSALNAAVGGASLPDASSALAVFTNPSALAGSNKVMVAFSGWGTGWREEITYHYTCTAPGRYSLGAMTPRGSFAFAVPLGNGFTAGAGIATVSQYEMKTNFQEYYEVASNHRELWKTITSDASGDLNECLVSFAGAIGPVNIGVSPGVRFGSGKSTTYSNRVSGPDSTFYDSWDHSVFAVRVGANALLGYTTVYSSYTSGDTRFLSSGNIGASAAFPFMNGGFLGAELGLLDQENLSMKAYTCIPAIVEGSHLYMGINGYRPQSALKTGIGISVGGDYLMGRMRFAAAYQFYSRYRDGSAVAVPYINHLYDSGETIVIGVETAF